MAILRCCYHTMFFSLDILWLWDMVSIRRLVQVPPSSSPYQVFTRFVCCFTINISWTFICSDQIIAKIKHFQSKTNFFFQLMAGRFWFCCFYGVFFFFLFMPSWNYESIISRLHGLRFDLSLHHVTLRDFKLSWRLILRP